MMAIEEKSNHFNIKVIIDVLPEKRKCNLLKEDALMKTGFITIISCLLFIVMMFIFCVKSAQLKKIGQFL